MNPETVWDDFRRSCLAKRRRYDGVICGVCAALAERLEWTPVGLRVAAVLGVFLVPWFTIPVYLLLAWLLGRRLIDGGDPLRPASQWRSEGPLGDRLRRLDDRLADLERDVVEREARR